MDAPSLSEAKRKVMDLLKRLGPTKASTLADALQLTRVAVRQHLQALEGQGWLVSQAEPPQGRGRPAIVWRLSGRAHRELFPNAHAEMTVGLIDAARQTFGEDGLQRLIEARSEQQVEAYRVRLASASNLKQRLESLAEQRSAEGYMAEVVPLDDGEMLLIEHHCPVCEAAKSCRGICSAELSVFRRSLGEDVEVERTQHLLTSGDRCAYRVRLRPDSAPDPSI